MNISVVCDMLKTWNNIVFLSSGKKYGSNIHLSNYNMHGVIVSPWFTLQKVKVGLKVLQEKEYVDNHIFIGFIWFNLPYNLHTKKQTLQ